MLKIATKKKLMKEIEQLTMDDFLFTTGKTIGTINPQHLSLELVQKTLDNETIVKVKMPFVDQPFNVEQIIDHPKREVIQTKKETYETYKEKYKNYNSVETEIFYLQVKVKDTLIQRINEYINKKYRWTSLPDYLLTIPDTFYILNWNIEPFKNETEFKEDDEDTKIRGYKAVKQHLYDYISSKE